MVSFDLVYDQIVVVEVIYAIDGAVVVVQVWVGDVGDADYAAAAAGAAAAFDDFVENQVLVGEN